MNDLTIKIGESEKKIKLNWNMFFRINITKNLEKKKKACTFKKNLLVR